MFNFEDANKKSKETMDTMLKSYASLTKAFQAIATEAADYSKKAFEDSVAHVEKISTVKSVEAAFELQTSYVKSAYEGYIAEATKIGEMYADLAKDAYKPYEAPVAKATSCRQVGYRCRRLRPSDPTSNSEKPAARTRGRFFVVCMGSRDWRPKKVGQSCAS